MNDGQVSVAVVVASANRPELLDDVVAGVEVQTWPVGHRVLSVPDRASLPDGRAPDGWLIVHDSGSAAQRNAGIAAVPDAAVIFFFDDDAVLAPDYIERAMETFVRYPAVVGLTGRVLLDGAAGREIGREEAAVALKRHAQDRSTTTVEPVRSLYGCNFAFRAASAPGMLFDAKLPLYSWLEDREFARRLAPIGGLVRANGCVIVHRGVKSGGRMAHTRFGYSQVMNPCYFVGKGSFSVRLAVWEMFRPVAKNVAKSIVGAERGWRRERLRGNWLAAVDVVQGRLTPERILEL